MRQQLGSRGHVSEAQFGIPHHLLHMLYTDKIEHINNKIEGIDSSVAGIGYSVKLKYFTPLVLVSSPY